MAKPSSAFIQAIQTICPEALAEADAFKDTDDLIKQVKEALPACDRAAAKYNAWFTTLSADAQAAAKEIYELLPLQSNLTGQTYGSSGGYCETLPSDWNQTADATLATGYVKDITDSTGRVAIADYDSAKCGTPTSDTQTKSSAAVECIELAMESAKAGGTSLEAYLRRDQPATMTISQKFLESKFAQVTTQAALFAMLGPVLLVPATLAWGAAELLGYKTGDIIAAVLKKIGKSIPAGAYNASPLLSIAILNDSPAGEAAAAEFIAAHAALQDLQRAIRAEAQAYEDAIYECMKNEACKGSDLGCASDLVCKKFKSFFGTPLGLECPENLTISDAEDAENLQNINDLASGGLGGALAATNFAGARNFKEQCFLLAKIFELAKYKKEIIEIKQPKKLPYFSATPPGQKESNACLMAEGQPYGFINKLIQSPNQALFYDMPTDVISSLMPKIQLYKVISEPAKDKEGVLTGEILETEQEYKFDSNTTFDDMMNVFWDKGKRGFGVGIKDFSFTYDGNNPFAAKKSIKAKLTIFANSFDELLRDRGGYSYIELALKTGGALEKSVDTSGKTAAEIKAIMDNLSKLNFRLKAVCGWAMPKGKLTYNTTAYGLKGAIDNSFMSLNLTPTTHEFDIDQQGRVNFTVNYLAYVDDAFDQPNYNIFSNLDVSLKTYRRTLRYKTLKTKCLATEVAEIKKGEMSDSAIDQEKQASMMTVMNRLIEINKMKYINIKYSDIVNFQSLGPYAELGGEASVASLIQPSETSLSDISSELLQTYTQALGVAREENKEDALKLSMLANNPHINNIPFFYVSDLVDVILEGIDKNLEELPGKLAEDETIKKYKEEGQISESDLQLEINKLNVNHLNFKKIRVLLGPLEIVNPKENGETEFVNFGDIPISAKYFTEWMTEKMIKKEQSVYPLSRFLNDFFNNLIRNFLNDDSCFSSNAKQRTVLNQAVLTSYKNTEDDPFSDTYNEPKVWDELTEYIVDPPEAAYSSKTDDWSLSRILLEHGNLPQPILNVAGSRNSPIANPGQERETNYLVFFAGRTQPAELMRGLRHSTTVPDPAKPGETMEIPGDESRGIFHYMLGKNKGIVKKIELSRTDAKFLKEVRFEQEGYNGLEQLREVYDVSITTYANVAAFPGTYIYVDPQGFAPNSMVDGELFDLTQFGIGGYCMVIRNETTFGPGQAETKLTAKWVASIGAKGTVDPPPPKKDAATNPDGSATNNPECTASSREEKANDTNWLDSVLDFLSIDKDTVSKAAGSLGMDM